MVIAGRAALRNACRRDVGLAQRLVEALDEDLGEYRGGEQRDGDHGHDERVEAGRPRRRQPAQLEGEQLYQEQRDEELRERRAQGGQPGEHDPQRVPPHERRDIGERGARDQRDHRGADTQQQGLPEPLADDVTDRLVLAQRRAQVTPQVGR
jgi:hypothetical protein